MDDELLIKVHKEIMDEFEKFILSRVNRNGDTVFLPGEYKKYCDGMNLNMAMVEEKTERGLPVGVRIDD